LTNPTLESRYVALFWTGLLFIGVASFCMLHSEILLGDPDLWWHIVTGQGILQTWHVPYTDTYSYTFAGHAWIAKEWLSQVFLAQAFNVAGWSGVLTQAALSAALALALLNYELSKSLHPTIAFAVSVIVAMSMISITIARPHIFTFALLVFFTARIFRAVDEHRSPEFWLLAVVTFWTNLHGSFTISFAIVGFAFLYCIEKHGLKNKTLIGKWILFGILCPVAALINPYGIQPLLVNKTLFSGIQAMSVIVEWQPFNAQESILFDCLVLLSIGLIWLARPRLALSKVLFLLFTLYMMLAHIRFIYVYFLLLPIIVAREVAIENPKLSIAAYSSKVKDNVERFVIRFSRSILVVVAAVATFLISAPSIKATFAPPASRNIAGAFSFIKSHNLNGPVFNAYNFGGPLIMQGVKTYIDGRADQIFQGDFFKNYISTDAPGGEQVIENILQTNRVTWTIFPPSAYQNTYFAKLLNWKKTYEDQDAVIFERAN
jgi:hypothetical protein